MQKKKPTTPVWKKPSPNKGKGQKLTPAQKAAAKERARKAGRPYPNLIDNMWAAREAKKANNLDFE